MDLATGTANRDEGAREANLANDKAPTTTDLAGLGSRIAILETKLELNARNSAELARISEQLVSTKVQIDLEQKLNAIHREYVYWRIIAAIGVAVVAAGFAAIRFWGLTSYEKVMQAETDQIRGKLEKSISFSTNLAYGLAYQQTKPALAVPYLLECFQEQPNNEAVLQALLSALDDAEDWNGIASVLQELKKRPIDLADFKEPLTYNDLGNVELALGLRSSDELSLARGFLDKGLQMAERNTPDIGLYWALHFNLWRYHLVTHDLDAARSEIALLKKQRVPEGIDSWSKASDWKWFKEYFDLSGALKRSVVEAMYKEAAHTAN